MLVAYARLGGSKKARTTMSETLDALTAELAAGLDLDAERYETVRSEAESSGRVAVLELLSSLAGAATTAAHIDTLRREVLSTISTWVVGSTEDSGDLAEQGEIGRRLVRLLTQLGESDTGREVALKAFEWLPDAELAWALSAQHTDDRVATALVEWSYSLSVTPEQQLQAALKRASLAVANGDVPVANSWLSKVEKLSPEDTDATALRAQMQPLIQNREERLVELRAAVDATETESDRADALSALARALRESPSGVSEASAIELEAAELDPANFETAKVALHALIEQEEWDRAAAMGARWLEELKDTSRIEAARIVGQLFAPQSAYNDLAVDALRMVLRSNKSDATSVDALVRLYIRNEAWDEAIDILQSARRATRERPDERRWLAQEGELLWKYKDEMLAAERVFRRVRAVDPNNVTALEFFEEHFERQSDWKRLHATLSQKFTLVEPGARLELATRMAELAESKMDKLDKAIEPYKRILADEPDNTIASERLIDLYTRTGKWYALVDFLQSRVRQLPDDSSGREQKVSLLFQIIDIYQDPDKLPVEEMVIQNYKRIVQLSPTNARALDDLAQHYEDAHRWSELVGVLQKKIELLLAQVDEAVEADDLLDLFHRVAMLYVEKMSSESQAVPFLERILEIDPSNLEVVRTLRSIYKSKHNLERLYVTWERELEFLQGDERIAVLGELAALATDKLYWHEAAIGHWEELLANDASNDKAASSLLSLYVKEEMWDRYAALLASRLDHARTRRRKIEILEKLGPIQFERLGALEDARNTYRELFELSPGHRSAVRALQRIYVALEEWESLRELFADQQDWSGYITFLDELCVEVSDSESEQRLHLEASRIYDQHLHDSAKAIVRLESAFELDREDTEVAQLLLEHYEGARRTDDVLSMLDRLSRLVEQPEEQTRYLEKGLTLLEELGRWSDAFEWLRRLADVLLLEGQSIAEVVHRVDAIAQRGELESEIAAWYGDAQAQVLDIDERCAVLQRQAALLSERLRRGADAVEVYEELSLLAPDDIQVLDALERLTQAEKDWNAFERTLSRKLELHERLGELEPLKLVGLKLARLLEDILDDPERAVDVYRRVLSQLPGDEDAFWGLESLFSTEDRWEDLLVLRRSRLEQITSPDGKVTEMVAIARVMMSLEDISSALDCLAEALQLVAAAPEAVELIWSLFEHQDYRQRVGELIEGTLRDTKDYPRLITLLTDRLERTVEMDERRRLLDELASLRSDGLGHTDAAYSLRLEHVALDPSDESARTALENLAGLSDSWETVAGLYATVIGMDAADFAPKIAEIVVQLESPEDEAALTLRLAEIYEAQLEKLEQSVECYERVLSYKPSSLETLAALERLHARLADWEALLAVYSARLDLIWDEEDKKALYLDICQLIRDELDRPEDAIEYYQEYLVLDEQNSDVIEELEVLYAQFERWDDLISLYRRRLAMARLPGDRIDVLMQMASVHKQHLDDTTQAYESYASILTIEPEHGAAVDSMVMLLQDRDHIAWSALVPRLADTLQPWFAKHGDWEREISVLKARRDVAVSDGDRAGHSYSIGQLYEGPGRSPEEAFDAYCSAVSVDPGTANAAAALERTARQLSRFEKWADVLEAAASNDEPRTAIPLLLSLGDISRSQLDDLDRAIASFEHVLRLEPLHREALEALDGLYDLTDRVSDRTDVLEKCAEIAEDDATRRLLRFEIGVLLTDLQRPDEAIDSFTYVADHGDPAHETLSADALDRLLVLYEETERTSDLISTLVRKADYSSEEHRRELLMRAADLSENALSDVSRAIELYDAVRALDADDSEVCSHLERLLLTEERYTDLEDLLLELRSRVDGERATVLDMKLGRLYDDQLRRRSDAIDRYEAVLDREPMHPEARESLQHDTDDELGLRSSRILERAYEATGSYDALISILERQLSTYAELINVPNTHRRLAVFYETHNADLDLAFEHYCHAARLEWTCEDEKRGELVRLAAKTGRWDELEETDREALASALEHGQRLRILSEMARVATEERNVPDIAETILREILDESPGQPETLEALRELYDSEGRYVPMVEILREQAEAADATEKTALLYTIAAVLRDQLDDAAGAAQVYEQVISEDPTESGAWDALEAIFNMNEDFESAVGILERRSEQTEDDEEKFLVLERRMLLLREHLDDRARALDAGTILLEINPGCRTAIEIFEECRVERFEYDRVVRQLIPVYEEQKDWEALKALYVEYADESDTTGRVWAYQALLALEADVLGNPQAAFEHTMSLTRCEPELPERWQALEREASQLGRYPEAVALYGELLDEGRAGLSLALRAATLCETQLSDTSLAAEFYERVLDLEIGHSAAEEALERIYPAVGAWDSLVALHERQLDTVATDTARVALLDRLYEIHNVERGDSESASSTLCRRLELVPDHRPTYEALLAAYLDAERHEDVEALYRRWLDVAEGEDVANTRIALARFLATSQDDITAAIFELETVLADTPGYAAALELLESMFEDGGEHTAEVAEILDRQYDEDSPFESRENVLLARIGRAVEDDDETLSLQLNRRLGQLYRDVAEDDEAAFAAFAAAVRLAPGDEELRAELEVIATRSELFVQLDACLSEALGGELGDTDRITLLHRLAELESGVLAAPERAAERYEALLEIDPSDQEALIALEAYYTETNQASALVRVLRARLDSASKDESRIELLGRLGDLALSNDDIDAAIIHFRDALDIDPGLEVPKLKLTELHRVREDWEELVSILRMRLDEVTDSDTKIELLEQIAEVQEQKIQSIEDAIDTFQDILSHSAANVYAVTSLERLLPTVEDWNGLLAVYERKKTLVADPRARAEVDFQIGQLLYDRLEQPESALDAFRLVLLTDATHEETVQYLERMLDDTSLRMAASFALEPIYESTGNDAALAGLLDRQIADAADSDDKVQLLKRVARLRFDKLSEGSGAMEALREAIILSPADTELHDQITSVAEATELYDALADALEAALGTTSDNDTIVVLNGWLGRLYEDKLASYELAIERWRDALSYDPSLSDALQALARLLEREERWDELVDIQRQELTDIGGERARVIRERLGMVLLERLDQPEDALDVFRSMVFDDPNDSTATLALTRISQEFPDLREEVLRVLTPLHQTAERWSELIDLLLSGVTQDTETHEIVRVHLDVAEICSAHLQDNEQAYAHYRTAFLAAPTRLDILERLEPLAEQIERFDDLEGLYAQAARSMGAGEERRELLTRAGRISLERLSDRGRAEDRFKQVIALYPDDYIALTALEQIYEHDGRVGDLIEICEAKVKLQIDLEERIEIHRKVAKASQYRSEIAKAIQHWAALVELNTTDLDALEALDFLYSQEEKHVERAKIMELRAAAADDPEVSVATRIELARLLAGILEDATSAIETLEEAVLVVPNNEEALTLLDSLYSEIEDWTGLARTLERRLGVTDSGTTRISLLTRLAVLEATRLERWAAATARFEEVLVSRPDDPEILRHLTSLYEMTQQWEPLVDVLKSRARLADSTMEFCSLTIIAAKAARAKLKDDELASGLAADVLQRDPNNLDALRLRARILSNSEANTDALAAWETLLPQLVDVNERIEALMMLGDLHQALGNSARALSAFRDTLALDAEHDAAIQKLKEVLYHRESWEALVPVLEKEFSRADNPHRRADIAWEIARINRDRLGRKREAVGWLRKGYDDRREHPEIVGALVDHYIESGSWEEAEPLLAWFVSYLEAKRQYQLLSVHAYRLGEMYEAANHPKKAISAYKRAYQADSQKPQTMLALGRLLLADGQAEKALQTLQGLLLVQQDMDDGAQRIEMLLLLVRAEMSTGEQSKARRHLKRLLQISPSNAEALALQKKL
jgi:tetratricopeptide (TPR) repeat protein